MLTDSQLNSKLTGPFRLAAACNAPAFVDACIQHIALLCWYKSASKLLVLLLTWKQGSEAQSAAAHQAAQAGAGAA